jgi:hypothetical protein
LRPKDGVVAPTLYWDLSGADLSGQGKISLTLADTKLQSMNLEGKIVDENGAGVSGKISLVSESISGIPNASYAVNITTGADGVFKTQIVAGKYQIVARADNESKALAVAQWDIDAMSFCCGRSITVRSKTPLTGGTNTPTSPGVPNATLVASPTLPPMSSYITSALQQNDLPREAQALIADDGSFSLMLDEGSFDIEIRPHAETLFPWAVDPGVAPTPGVTHNLSLPTPFPAVVHGNILYPTNDAATGATLRAWLPIQVPNSDPPSFVAVQIGETQTDETGHYVLPLPPTVPPAGTQFNQP